MEVQKIVWKKFENRWKFCNNQGLDTFWKVKSPTRRTDGGLGWFLWLFVSIFWEKNWVSLKWQFYACLDGRFQGCCRKVCPLKGLFWTFQISTRLSDFSKCIYNNSYCYYNKKLFHEKSQNFFEKSRGFFYLFFWKFYSAIRFNVYNNFNFKNQKHLFKNFHFYFVRNNIRQK